ncbi:MAG TPA: hypothetical protein VJT73_16530, partial [Polyangiaceae bacterium]|nr:hypothetical protein [Polyangiaceae bacterium]
MPYRLRRSFGLFYALCLASCGRSGALPSTSACPLGASDVASPIEVKRLDGRPALALVARDGDPAFAIAAAVTVEGSAYVKAALAGLLEARLKKAGLAVVEVRADLGSLRIRSLIDAPSRSGEFMRRVRDAMGQPIVAATPEMAVAHRRVQALRRHPFEAPIMARTAACTGELGTLATEPALDPTSTEGTAELEAARRAACASNRVAFGFIGSRPATLAVIDDHASSEMWSKAAASVSPTAASSENIGAFVSSERAAGTARLTLALPARRAETAIAAARDLGEPDGALVARLAALPYPFRVS